jgi:ribosome-associated protein
MVKTGKTARPRKGTKPGPRRRTPAAPARTPAKVPPKALKKAARKPLRPPSAGPDTTRPLALAAVQAALDKKGERPIVLDVRGISSYADYLLLVSAESERQVAAIADAIEERLGPLGGRVLGIEQPGESGWMLVDLGDLVVHLFFRGSREAYDLEGLWVDAPRVRLP